MGSFSWKSDAKVWEAFGTNLVFCHLILGTFILKLVLCWIPKHLFFCIGSWLCYDICSRDLLKVCICIQYNLISVIMLLVVSSLSKFLMYLLKNIWKNRPFGRLWWDEIVATVVTRAEPHNQVIILNCVHYYLVKLMPLTQLSQYKLF